MSDHMAALPNGVWPTMITPFNHDKTIDWHCVDALVEWYIDGGVAGIFGVCLSSEFYELSPEERLELAARVVRRSAGRVPVVASGTFGGPLEEQAQYMRKIFDTGVSAVVVLTCQLVGQEEADPMWLARAQRLQQLTADLPLGLYECPVPYKRLMSAELMGHLAASRRFVFHKDTSCDAVAIEAKIGAVLGSRLNFYNAHLPTLLHSLKAGGNGYSGIAANYYPELIAWLCAHFEDQPGEARRLQDMLTTADLTAHQKYPTAAKVFLRLRGLDIEPVCRVQEVTLDSREMQTLQDLLGCVEDAHSQLD